MVIGWDQSIDDTADDAARYYFDRLIGANVLSPKESPPQRPFDHLAVISDMKRAGLLPATYTHDGKTITANLTSTAGSGDYALLAPTIKKMTVSERQKTLTIDGLFGSDPGLADGKVFIGNKEMTSRAWGSDQIVVNNLPASGDGSAGDVYVEVRKHQSNIVQLTFWKIRFRTLLNAFPPDPRDTLKQEGFLEVHFRADVHSYRDDPHATPIEPVVLFDEISDSSGQYTSSGRFLNTKGDIIESWSGTSIVKALGSNLTSKNILTCFGSIDLKQKKIDFTLLGAAIEGMFSTSPPEEPTPLPATTGHLDGGFSGSDPTPALHLTLNQDFSIDSSVRNEDIGGLRWHLEWDKVVPLFPPDPKAARSVPIRR